MKERFEVIVDTFQGLSKEKVFELCDAARAYYFLTLSNTPETGLKLGPSPILQRPIAEPIPVKVEEKTAGPTMEEQGPVQNEERAAVIQELNALGIKFAKSTNTEALAAKLHKEKTKHLKVKSEPKSEALAVETEEKVVSVEVATLDEARALLQTYAQKEGVERAKTILSDFGVTKLSDLDDVQRLKLVKILRG
jgi:hypothetical protein